MIVGLIVALILGLYVYLRDNPAYTKQQELIKLYNTITLDNFYNFFPSIDFNESLERILKELINDTDLLRDKKSTPILLAKLNEINIDQKFDLILESMSFGTNGVLNKKIEEALRGEYDGQVFKTVIRDNVALAEAPTQGRSIFEYAPTSNGAQDYQALGDEVFNLLYTQ
jgi:hypothetical protein